MKLKYNDNGKFRILQLTDTHFGNFPFKGRDLKTLDLITKAVEQTRPDLIINTGDVIYSHGMEPYGHDPELIEGADETFRQYIIFMNQFGIPHEIAYGNHDSEGDFPRSHLRKIYEETATNQPKKEKVMVVEDRENFVMEVYDSKETEVRNVLYIIDSGNYAKLPSGDWYDRIAPEQVDWYREVSDYYRKGDKVKRNIMFQHIPIPEFWDAEKNRIDGVVVEGGDDHLPIPKPLINSGLFYHMVLDEETWGMVCGHNHNNNYHGIVQNINLINGQCSGYNTYGVLEKGVRVIDLDINDGISTYRILHDELD